MSSRIKVVEAYDLQRDRFIVRAYGCGLTATIRDVACTQRARSRARRITRERIRAHLRRLARSA